MIRGTLADLSPPPPAAAVTSPALPPRAARPVVVAVANAKGGVGKTSIAANLVGLAAAQGAHVLAVDLDPQGNLAVDLGYKEASDQGHSLASVFRHMGSTNTLAGIRPGLDAWAGGRALTGAIPRALIPETAHPLTDAIAATGSTYELVVIDCPPALGPLVDAGLFAADLLLVPIRADHASLDGLAMISERYRATRMVRPDLELLGVVLFDVSRAATALVREIAAAISASFAGETPRALPAIRRSERAAYEMRRRGRLAHELAAQAPPNSAIAHLAGDYAELARSVLDAISERRARRA